jgi:hypothetical protein
MAAAGTTNNRALADGHEGWTGPEAPAFAQDFISIMLVMVATLAAFVLRPLVGYRAVALIYLLGVVVMALFVGRGPIPTLPSNNQKILKDFSILDVS